MEKTFTTQEAMNAYNGLSNFIDKDIDLPIQVAWDIESNIEEFKKIADRFDKYQLKILQPLQDQGGLRYENNNTQIFPAEGFESQFQEVSIKLNEALDTENTINITTITKDQLPDVLSIKDLEALKFMIKNEDS